MKKILIILIISFSFITNAKASPYKKLNVSIGCYSTGEYLRHLDRTKDDFFRGYFSDTRTWDGKKEPEFNLLITMEDKSVGNSLNKKWQGEIIYLDLDGKKKFKPTGLISIGDGEFIDFSIVAVSENSSTGYTTVLNITPWRTTETKEEYYNVVYTKIENIKEALSKRDKQLSRQRGEKDFRVLSRKHICFK